MKTLAQKFPPGLHYKIAYNPTTFISQSIDAVYETLRDALILVAIVVLVFLQSWRATVIPMCSIPVSLVGTLAVMKVFGFSLNNLSLFGLVLAIGIVVDDAIVVVENVERWLEEGHSPIEATTQGDGRGQRRGRGHRHRADGGVRADGAHLRDHGAVLPAVRADHCGGDDHLRVQLADALSPALAALLLPKPQGRQEGLAHARPRPRAGLVLPACSTGRSMPPTRVTPGSCSGWCVFRS